MNNLKLGIAALIIFAAGAAIGYYKSPTKIEKKIVEKEIVITKTEKVYATRKVTKPDGTVIEETKLAEKETNKSKTERKEEKLVENDGNQYSISALVANSSNLRLDKIVYGLAVDKKFIGPIKLGAFGFTDGRIGLSLGLSF